MEPSVTRRKRRRRGGEAKAPSDLKALDLTRRSLLGAGLVGGAAAAGYAISQVLKPSPARIDLANYELSFSEDFNDPNFSLEAFNKRWYPHTPWWGDFGDAAFTDPTADFPFSIKDGNLRIEARKGDDGKWRSGLISSVNRQGVGFSQLYGYFEVRAKLPPGEGVWPSFWLDSWYPDMKDPSVEVDVFEYYGKFPEGIHSTVIVWPKDGTKQRAVAHVHHVAGATLSEEFHTYGVSVESDWIVFFFDGAETWRTETPIEHKHPLMILVDLGLGSGWPIDKTLNPSFLDVDYIRAYRRKQST